MAISMEIGHIVFGLDYNSYKSHLFPNFDTSLWVLSDDFKPYFGGCTPYNLLTLLCPKGFIYDPKRFPQSNQFYEDGYLNGSTERN